MPLGVGAHGAALRVVSFGPLRAVWVPLTLRAVEEPVNISRQVNKRAVAGSLDCFAGEEGALIEGVTFNVTLEVALIYSNNCSFSTSG